MENFRNADGDLVLRPVPTERGSGKPNVLRRLDARAFERVAGLRLENWAENSAPPPVD